MRRMMKTLPKNSNTATGDEILDANEAARRIGTTPATLNTWRCTKKVRIPFIRIGSAIRYRASAIEKFLQDNTVE